MTRLSGGHVKRVEIVSERLPPRLVALKAGLVARIPVDDDKKATAALLEKPLSRVVAHYFNWIDRFIAPRPRQTVLWDGILNHSTQKVDLLEIAQICGPSERGEDLQAYLSHRPLKCGFSVKTNGRGGIVWEDKDLALNAYGVHHLHFIPANKSGSRKGNSSKLLYALVSRDTFTPIMVGDHKSFDDGSLFTAVASLRAELGWALKGISPPSNQDDFTLKENARLARGGVTTMAVVGGNVVPAANLSTAGTSVEHQQHVGRVMRAIHGWEDILDDRIRVAEAFKSASLPETPSWRWRFYYGDLLLEEKKSKSRAHILNWKR
ncbi:hypothetical protein G6L89_010420 [Agrobacterium fabrum]|uniref:hypothetical protein n=1 Tax=Agrobacterium fabrum TaxID=1176649 RepID=UPI001574801C|nr:hypothetical protein [Agrobacterium fabrum]NTB08242.1 hypothetical protein [Agrobacterium fabrum]